MWCVLGSTAVRIQCNPAGAQAGSVALPWLRSEGGFTWG